MEVPKHPHRVIHKKKWGENLLELGVFKKIDTPIKLYYFNYYILYL